MESVALALLVVLVGCGSQSASSTSTSTGPSGPSDADLRAERERKERAERALIVDKHRKLESAQQDALGATCTDAAKWATQHCTPSCYPAEQKDARAGIKLAGSVELQHTVCQRGDGGPWMIVEEVDAKPPVAKQHRGRIPKPHKKGSWQAEIATALAEARIGKAPRGELFAVVDPAVHTVKHAVTHESLRCVSVVQYTTLPRATLDGCGTAGKSTCEVAGNAAARGINLARFRLAEAAALKASGKETECQAAALDAVATARGLPRWRQYAKLNVGEWTEGLAYKTRFDGVLDEDGLFAIAPTIEAEAARLYQECGAPGTPKTTPEQEHAFHSCP